LGVDVTILAPRARVGAKTDAITGLATRALAVVTHTQLGVRIAGQAATAAVVVASLIVADLAIKALALVFLTRLGVLVTSLATEAVVLTHAVDARLAVETQDVVVDAGSGVARLATWAEEVRRETAPILADVALARAVLMDIGAEATNAVLATNACRLAGVGVLVALLAGTAARLTLPAVGMAGRASIALDRQALLANRIAHLAGGTVVETLLTERIADLAVHTG
jgi:hypothetical protein